MNTTSPFMTSGEVAAIFRVHPRTVTHWPWPPESYIKTPGGHLRYRRAFVIDLVESGLGPMSERARLAAALLES